MDDGRVGCKSLILGRLYSHPEVCKCGGSIECVTVTIIVFMLLCVAMQTLPRNTNSLLTIIDCPLSGYNNLDINILFSTKIYLQLYLHCLLHSY